MSMLLLKWSTLVLVIIYCSLITYLTNQDFIISSGSDILTTIIKIPAWLQVLSLCIFIFSIYVLLFVSVSFLGKKSVKAMVFAISLFIYIMSVHLVVIDGKESKIKDTWGLVDIQQISFDPIDGPSLDITHERSWCCLDLHNDRANQKIKIFLGITPWRIEIHGILGRINRSSADTKPAQLVRLIHQQPLTREIKARSVMIAGA